MVLACVIGTIGYGIAAFTLTLVAFSRFDIAADRPGASCSAPRPRLRPIGRRSRRTSASSDDLNGLAGDMGREIADVRLQIADFSDWEI